MQNAVGSPDPAIFTLLAAQVAALRDRIESGAADQMSLLWKATDAVSELAGLVRTLTRFTEALPTEVAKACAAAEANAQHLSGEMDDLSFVNAQRADLTRQMAEGVVTVLRGLGAGTASFSPEDIAALYVSHDQHVVHAAALEEFGDR